MKLYHLTIEDYNKFDGSKWYLLYESAREFVVRADTEESARKFADAQAGVENKNGNNPWLDPSITNCDELTTDGDAGVIVRDFLHG